MRQANKILLPIVAALGTLSAQAISLQSPEPDSHSKAVNEYTIVAPTEQIPIIEGGLNLGGTSSTGRSIELNNYYMSIDGKPIIPVTGEFHYSRYPSEQWEQEILKIKAGGVNVIPTYVFWNFHEPYEGHWNWEGDYDLRKFIELCRKHDMWVIIRIGPFCHGEVRNGGIPDWVFAKAIDVRSNDPLWLDLTQKLYKQIAKQLDGLFFKDGGPIIGTQIENEHQHSAAPWAISYPDEPKDYTASTYDSEFAKVGVSVQLDGMSAWEKGEQHMKTLKGMAVEAGFDTPLYTVTGWGNAAVISNEAIPVTAAYPINFWSQPRMSEFMLFTNLHKKPDYSPVRYNPEEFPSFAAEMGVGMQPIYSRRPIPNANDAQALMLRTLGSGANCIGYYMYHGGSTPKMPGGTGFYSDESMGIPKISYDYFAPLGEFGLEYESYRPLRTIHSFLADFSARLAPMEVVMADNAATMTQDNREDLRYSVRMRDGSGFVFMSNYQDHDTCRHDLENLAINIDLSALKPSSDLSNQKSTSAQNIRIPSQGFFTLPKDASVIIPFNFDMDGVTLTYSTTQPLMRIDDGGTPHYFFFALDGMTPEYLINGKLYRPTPGFNSTFTVNNSGSKSKNNNKSNSDKVKVTTLTREQALNALKVNGKLLITDASVLADGDEVTLLQQGNNTFEYVLYPSKEGFAKKTVTVEEAMPDFSWQMQGPRRMTITFDPTERPNQVNEWFAEIDYDADVAMAFLDNEMVLDHFWTGAPWRIGLNRFEEMTQSELGFYFRPLRPGASFLIDIPKEDVPDLSEGPVLKVNSVKILPQYKARIRIR